MTSREIVEILERDGWFSIGQTGSHRKFRHPTKPGLIVVPMHAGKGLGKGLEHSILKKAGLK